MTIGDDAHVMRSSRRTVVRGAAWSVPVIATAATAPAFAASPIPCPLVPASSLWTPTAITGSPAAKLDANAWDNDRWVVWRDNGSATQSLTFQTQSPTFAVTAGATYNGSFSYFWQFGNGRSDQSSRGTFEILFNGVSVASLSRVGTAQTTTTRLIQYVVPNGTTALRITYRYVVAPQGSLPASDDITVGRLVFNTCSVN